MSTHPRMETYGEKAARKFKQEPLVPLGALATTVALIIAANKLRKGESRSLNTWLRVRIVAQGLTVAAVVAGTYVYGKKLEPAPAAAQAEVREAPDARGFEDRLRAAEEAHAFETGQPVVVKEAQVKEAPVPVPVQKADAGAGSGGSWYSWSRWVGGGKKDSDADKPSS
ncbi:hypothetical protein DENSPDRAFT_871860 [Dentipellis sp. KUC8613]|nr:hypothetical protein DENSPDRAFT_871860 [Dentipellis sp. KUC8613]